MMSTPGSPAPASSPRPGATPEKRALLEAFDSVLKTQAEARLAEARAAEARRRVRARVGVVVWGSLVVLLFTAAYLWVERPAWVFPPPVAAESRALQEASLRVSLANAAQHVELYRQRHGRLPESLAAAGAHGAGIRYEAGDSTYRLAGVNGPITLTLNSSDSLPRFVGKSFDVIARRPR
jgi:hypothetical protein